MNFNIEITPVKRGQEHLWTSIGVDESLRQQQSQKFAAYLNSNPTLPPENYLLAISNGEVVGKMAGVLESTGYIATNMVIKNDSNEAIIAQSFFSFVAKHGPVQALSWANRTNQEAWRRILTNSSFEIYQDKEYFTKTITDYSSPYESGITLKPLTHFTKNEVLSIHRKIYENNLNRNFNESNPDLDFLSHEESSAQLLDYKRWYVVQMEDAVIGILLPQKFYDSQEEGTIMSFGLAHGYRGKGLGKTLHALGLQVLSEQGVKKYIGSTDVNNQPMLNVFRSNGCESLGIRSSHRRRQHG